MPAHVRTTDDASLLAALIAGEERAFSDVIRLIVPGILQTLKRQFRGLDYSALEDAMSVGLMRLWQNPIGLSHQWA